MNDNDNGTRQQTSSIIDQTLFLSRSGYRLELLLPAITIITGMLMVGLLFLLPEIPPRVRIAFLIYAIFMTVIAISNALIRSRYSHQLRVSEERYRTIVEDQPNFIVRWLPDGTIVFANRKYCDDMRRPPGKVIGMNFLHRASTEAKANILTKIHALTPENPVQISTHQATDWDGNVIWHQWSDRGIFNTDRQLIAIESIGTDVTSEKLLEQQQTQLKIADEREALMQEFLGTITHDLKTPLSVMNTSLYLMQRNDDAGAQQRYIDNLQTQIKRQEHLVNNILSIVRLSHLPHTKQQPCDVDAMIPALLETLKSKCEAKNLTVQPVIASDTKPVPGDPEQLERLLLNLVENAINYTPEGGNITIITAQDTDHYVLTVADTGIGIPEADLDNIFSRFYRSSNTRHTDGGTGLGLAIVKQIVELHGGNISVQSVVGDGTTFTVRLPVINH